MSAAWRRQVAGLERRDRAVHPAGEDIPGDRRDPLDREPELLEDRPGRGRRPVVVEPDDCSGVADPALPAERHARLHGDPGANRRRQDRIAIRLVLELEPLPAGKRDHARRDALGLELLGRSEREVELRAGPDQDDLGITTAAGLAEDVPAAAQALARLLGRARERRQLLASQREPHRPGGVLVPSLDRQRPRRDRLVRIARPDEPEVRHRPERRVVLDRLMGGSVLVQT